MNKLFSASCPNRMKNKNKHNGSYSIGTVLVKANVCAKNFRIQKDNCVRKEENLAAVGFKFSLTSFRLQFLVCIACSRAHL